MRLAGCLALAILWAGASGNNARAQPVAATADSIQLDLLDCEWVSSARVRELVTLEVAPRRVLAVGSAERAATRAELSCQAGVAQILVDDAGLTAPLRLEIALSDLETNGRSRLLALAVAELIATSRLQRTQLAAADAARDADAARASEAASVPTPDPPEELPTSRVPAQSGAQLWLALGAARIAEPSLIGPMATAGLILYRDALALSADVRFEHAQTTRSVAELQLDAGSLALVPAWRLQLASAELLIGPGVRAGYASLRATPRQAALSGLSVHGFWFAPCAQLALQLRFAQHWALRFGAELAYITRTLRGLDANGETLLELRNLALAAQLGISWDAVLSR